MDNYGNNTAVGNDGSNTDHITDNDQQTAPTFQINKDQDHHLNPIRTRNLGEEIANDVGDMNGISKMAFSPTQNGLFVCGTENIHSHHDTANCIAIGNINTPNDDPLSLFPVNEDMRDLGWLTPNRLVVALDSKLGILELNDANEIASKPVLFPDFHKDTIRQISVNEGNSHLVLSGGFDGNVFVTNITRLVDDMEKNEQNSENSVYMCGDVVGSVSWHPRDFNVASCTTDPGWLHVFDIRTDQSKPAFVYDTDKLELFAHTYIDDFMVALGYGDGQVQIHDIRNGREVCSFTDPHLRAVGDLLYRPGPSGVLCAMGHAGLTLYHRPALSQLDLYGHAPSLSLEAHRSGNYTHQQHGYKTTGAFIPHTSLLAVTDSDGVLSLFDVTS
eukprot:gb/GECH01003615.1/.p1 GENE.gb/GECH01003615.1/~~gb/GECH01003615.1/.p1  ORF type:complete len:387 (+),score=55.16 gb/GECH01003615.1/:1-1161(+)